MSESIHIDGKRALGPSLLMILKKLLSEYPDGSPRYTVADLREIALAEPNSREWSTAWRICAIWILECGQEGEPGRRARNDLLDRVLGKPTQGHDVRVMHADANLELSRAMLSEINGTAKAGVLEQTAVAGRLLPAEGEGAKG